MVVFKDLFQDLREAEKEETSISGSVLSDFEHKPFVCPDKNRFTFITQTHKKTMPREQTYIMVKPDGVQRGLVGNIIARFEKKDSSWWP